MDQCTFVSVSRCSSQIKLIQHWKGL